MGTGLGSRRRRCDGPSRGSHSRMGPHKWMIVGLSVVGLS